MSVKIHSDQQKQRRAQMDTPKSAPKKLEEPEESTGTKVLARRTKRGAARVLVKKNPEKIPKKTTTLCKLHKKPMQYSATLGYWKCPEKGCSHKSLPKIGGTSQAPTVIKGAPKVIISYDEDGDTHYLLQYNDLGVVVELPFTSVLGHKVYNQRIDSSVVVNLKVTDVVFVDNNGSIIPIEKAKDR